MDDEEYIIKSPFQNKLDQSGDLYQCVETCFKKDPGRVAVVISNFLVYHAIITF